MKITLPFPPRKGQRLVFGALLGIALGLAVSLILRQFVPMVVALAALPLGILMGLAGSQLEEPTLFVYRAVNKLISTFAAGARFWISGVVFVILLVAGLVEVPSNFRERETGWQPVEDRNTLRQAKAARKGGIRSFLIWIRQSHNWWAVSLLPYFLLLSTSQTDHQNQAPPKNIYTLY